MTLAEQIAEKRERREALRAELLAVETELIDAGALLSVTVASAGLLRNRGRWVKGDSIRARVFAILSDGADWQKRDIVARLPFRAESVAAQLSRMASEGDIERPRHGWYRQCPMTTTTTARTMCSAEAMGT